MRSRLFVAVAFAVAVALAWKLWPRHVSDEDQIHALVADVARKAGEKDVSGVSPSPSGPPKVKKRREEKGATNGQGKGRKEGKTRKIKASKGSKRRNGATSRSPVAGP